MNKKEPIVAIIFGVLIGVLLALLLINIKGENTNNKADSLATPTPLVPLTAPIITESTLNITSPIEGDNLSTTSANLSGIISNKALLFIQTPIEDKAQLLEAGTFNIPIELKYGLNQILLTSYVNKQVNTKSLSVYVINKNAENFTKP